MGPHRLPGEIPGAPDDPYSRLLDASDAESIRRWALDLGATEAAVGARWTQAEDVIRACDAMDAAARAGNAFTWRRAAEALVDGDAQRLRYELTFRPRATPSHPEDP